jgi:hypothetical protein
MPTRASIPQFPTLDQTGARRRPVCGRVVVMLSLDVVRLGGGDGHLWRPRRCGPISLEGRRRVDPGG